MLHEDKQKICDLLCKTLQATRQYNDLRALTYNTDTELVTVLFENGSRHINVAMDSGSAMIRDIIKHLND